jgi:sarcosine oxidase subunit alpha
VTFGALAGADLGDCFDPIRQTALHEWHAERGARFEDVGQWKRPWYYPAPGEAMEDAVRRECRAVRNGVGIFDASTLGKIDIQGPDAVGLLNRVYCNGWSNLAVGRCRYGLMLGEDGMVMDDGVTARLAEHHYLMTTTTGGAARVLAWLERWLQTEWPHMLVYLTSVTEHWATIAVAGPQSRAVRRQAGTDAELDGAAFPFMSVRDGTVAGIPARIARISFSGELAFEINIAADRARQVWEALLVAGEPHGITPYGTEAMHVLRAEKGFIIVGQDTDGSVTPIDLGMGALVNRTKDCIGQRSLARSDTARTDRKQLIGLLSDDPSCVVPEGGQIVSLAGGGGTARALGHVTSSYYSDAAGRAIALALLEAGRERLGEKLHVAQHAGAAIPVTVVKPLFYDPEGARQNVQ